MSSLVWNCHGPLISTDPLPGLGALKVSACAPAAITDSTAQQQKQNLPAQRVAQSSALSSTPSANCPQAALLPSVTPVSDCLVVTARCRDCPERSRLLSSSTPAIARTSPAAGRLPQRALETVRWSFLERWVRVAENTCWPRLAARRFLKQSWATTGNRLRSGPHWPECVSGRMS